MINKTNLDRAKLIHESISDIREVITEVMNNERGDLPFITASSYDKLVFVLGIIWERAEAGEVETEFLIDELS